MKSKLLDRRSLYHQIFVSLSFFVVVFSILFSVLVGYQVLNETDRRQRAMIQEHIELAEESLTKLFEQIHTAHRSFAVDATVQSVFASWQDQTGSSQDEDSIQELKLEVALSGIVLRNPGITGVAVRSFESDTAFTITTNDHGLNDQILDDHETRNIWGIFQDKQGKDYLVYDGTVRSTLTTKQLARIMFLVDPDYLNRIIANQSDDLGYFFTLSIDTDAGGMGRAPSAQIRKDDNDQDAVRIETRTIHQESSLHVYINLYRKRDLFSRLGLTPFLIVSGSLFIVLLGGLVASRFIVNRMLISINVLREAMVKVGNGDLSVRANGESAPREIAYLSDFFNSMVEEVEMLLISTKRIEGEKRKLEIEALEKHTSAHFLLNSLETARSLISFNESQIASRMLDGMCNFFSLAYKNSEPMVPLSKELLLIQEYLEVVSIRSPDLFTFSVEATGPTDSIMIPRLAIQELVENGIQHGLMPSAHSGHLSVSAGFLSPETYRIEVVDNGIGFDEQSMPHQRGFGIESIRQRLHLQYGETAHMAIRLRDGKTSVTIDLPVEAS